MSRKIFKTSIVIIVFILIISIIASIFLGKAKDDNTDSDNTPTTVTDFSALSYCAFGDSITYGQLPSGGQMDKPYPTVVAETLGLKSYTNKGVGYATLTSCSGHTNITELVTSTTTKYNIISVMGGVNDYGLSLPLGTTADTTNDTVYGSLDMIADYLTTNYPSAFIFFMTPYKCKSSTIASCLLDNDEGYNLRDVAEAVEYVAAKYDIPVLDMFNEGQFEVVEMTSSGSDGVHPSQDFVNNYTAPQIVEFIKNNIS